MPKLNTLKKKIVLLLMSSIALVVLLIGIASLFVLDQVNPSVSLPAFQKSMLVVFMVAGLIAFVLSLLLARYLIINPSLALTTFVKKKTNGEMPGTLNFCDDELRVIASAFNEMTGAVQLREEMLRLKYNEIETVIENVPSVISIKAPDGKYLMVNHLFIEFFNIPRDEIIGKTDVDIFSEQVAQQFSDDDLRVIQSKKSIQVDESINQDGEVYGFVSNKFPLLDSNAEVIAICSIANNVTENRKAESKLMLARHMIDNANEAFVVTDLDGVIEEINDAYIKISGYEREEVVGKNPNILQSGYHEKEFYESMWQSIEDSGRWRGEMWDKRKNGEVYPKRLSINTVYDDEGMPYKYVGIFTDVTERKETEKQLEYLAYYDALTELPNRVMFYDRLQQAISTAKRDNHLLALMMIDLDKFKQVNDTLGHDAGDELLIVVAQKLKSLVRDSDTVARIGGDEFKIILTDIKSPDEASIVAQKLIENLRRPMRIKGRTVNIGASVGISIYPSDDEDIGQLVKYADLALYKAKDNGRNCYHYFSEDLQVQVFDHIEMESDMQKAIALGEFSLHYQPQIDLSDSHISGMEALIRWQHPRNGLIPPDQFIPFAEETGLIIPLSEWIMDAACEHLSAWSKKSVHPLNLGINLSAIQFQQKDLISSIKRIIDKHDIDPNNIELEITESMVMVDVDRAIETMHKLREIGVRLAIDDFGTGYSSLSYLKQFPINRLKIDQSFVCELGKDSKDAAMVRAIISMARDLGVEVVAEGVENREQLDFLTANGCQYVQGYYFSEPLDAELFNTYLEKFVG